MGGHFGWKLRHLTQTTRDLWISLRLFFYFILAIYHILQKKTIVCFPLLGFDPTCRICHVLRVNKVRHLNLHHGLDVVVGDDRLDLLPPRQHVLPRDRDSTKTFLDFFLFFQIGNWGLRHYFIFCDWGKKGLVFKVICARRFLPENFMPLKKKKTLHEHYD